MSFSTIIGFTKRIYHFYKIICFTKRIYHFYKIICFFFQRLLQRELFSDFLLFFCKKIFRLFLFVCCMIFVHVSFKYCVLCLYFNRIVLSRHIFGEPIHNYKFLGARARPGPEGHEGLARPTKARPGGRGPSAVYPQFESIPQAQCNTSQHKTTQPQIAIRMK